MPEEKKTQTLTDKLSSIRSGDKKTSEQKKSMTLKEKLDALTFSNRQAGDISKMQSGTSAVKESVSKRKRSSMRTSGTPSLQGLRNTLATQFSSK